MRKSGQDGQMMSKEFDAGAWIERLAAALVDLEKVQGPYLQSYQQQNTRKSVIVNGKDETPFPLDDLRMVYSSARYSERFGLEAENERLRSALDPTRHILLSHPELERVAVAGRTVGENNFWLRMLDSGTSISAGDLIAGLMARAAEAAGDRFRVAAGDLNELLLPDWEKPADALGNLDAGCDALLFFGLTVPDRIDVEAGMTILPFREFRRFMERELVEELAPSGAGVHNWRSLGAVVRPFRWRPRFRRAGSMNETSRHPGERFFIDARSLLDLIAVSHEVPVVPLATMSNRVDLSARRLLGQSRSNAGVLGKWSAGGIDGFSEMPMVSAAGVDEALEVFENRRSARYERMARSVARLAVALSRTGRFATQDKVLDVAVTLEGIYDLPRRGKSYELQKRVANFVGTDASDRERIRKTVRRLYNVRSEIVHSGSGEAQPFRKEAAFAAGFNLTRKSLFKFVRESRPEDWESLENSES